MPLDDPCIERLEKVWRSEQRKDIGKRSFQMMAATLRLLVKYVADPVAGVPEDWIPTIQRRIIYLEENLDAMSFKAVEKTLDALSYARRRITKSIRSPKHGRAFKTELTRAQRDRADRTINNPLIAGIKSTELAFNDDTDLLGESGRDDNDFGQSELD